MIDLCRSRTTILIAISTFASSIAGTTPTSAATLAPSKASRVITVASGPTPCFVNGRVIDVIQNADGTTSPFLVPAKQVFVVTSAEVTALNANPSDAISVAFQRVVGTTTNTLAFVNGAATTQGTFYGHVTIPSGAIVAPGVTICVFPTGLATGTLTGFAIVHGFFAPNK